MQPKNPIAGQPGSTGCSRKSFVLLFCSFGFLFAACSFDPRGISGIGVDSGTDADIGFCGDGIKGEGEYCDGDDLGGATCESLGYESGVLGCTPECTFDTTGCEGEVEQVCGNGVREGDEECDGPDLGGATCVTLGYERGTLGCTSDCSFNVSGCSTCGNGIREGVEQCDGEDFGGKTCFSETGHEQGELQCRADCTLNLSGCHTCGDNVVGGAEECDGESLDGHNCISLGFDGGTLRCTENCTFDTSDCYKCGDGFCNWAEGETSQSCPQDCGWLDISAGKEHTCGVRMDGTVWCWGRNNRRQLGDGTTSDSTRPVFVSPLQNAVGVAAGSEHSCAVLANGEVWCWGRDDKGQLGTGGSGDSGVPLLVSTDGGMGGAVMISAGHKHNCAVDAFQTAWCWGDGGNGRLGTGDKNDKNTPTPVEVPLGMADAATVSAGKEHTCALDVSGAVWCWGRDDKSQLGTGGSGDSDIPLRVSTDSGMDEDVIMVTAGEKHTCAADVSGALWCWGEKADGRLGDGLDQEQDEPSRVVHDVLSQGVFISAGEAHTCAFDVDDKPYCWGKNGHGQLGTNNKVPSAVPVPVHTETGLLNTVLISSGGTHTCAVRSNNWAYCWGNNGNGQLGIGNTSERVYPEQIMD